MRHPRVVARAALIAVLAAVAVPTLAVSRPPSNAGSVDPSVFATVRVEDASGPTTTIHLPSLPFPLDSYRDFATLPPRAADGERFFVPGPTAGPTARPATKPVVVRRWHLDPDVSWYGPGFYGGRTACGLAFTTTTLGVANRTLPCGTLVTFRNPVNGRSITVPVIDRGPYVAGRQWDLSGATCTALGHCYTGELLWRLP